MLKRLAIIAFFTGFGQLFSVLVLKLLSFKCNSIQLSQLAQVDSTFQFILSIIAMGLQSAAIRNLALSKNWQQEYVETQSARLMLSCLIFPISIALWVQPYFAICLLAPMLALSGDYALYALGFPVVGSVVALTRAIIPYSVVVAVIWLKPDYIVWAFCAGIFISYLTTNLFIARYLKTSLFFIPKWKGLLLYIKSFSLGLVGLSLYFIGLGVLMVVPYFYDASSVAVAFVGLKFYLIFKGVIRIIHQSFVKEMISSKVCLKIDQLSSLLGVAVAAFILVFPNTFISIFFGKKYNHEIPFFRILAAAMYVYSLFTSTTTKSLLDKRDVIYAAVASFAAIITLITTILFSFYGHAPVNIAYSLLIGEVVFCLGMIVILNYTEFLKERLLFYAQNMLVLAIPLLLKLWRNDDLLTSILALVLVSGLFVTVYLKKFTAITA